MHEEMSRKEDTGKVGLKRSRHRIETAGAQCRHSRRLVRGKSCQGISCCHKSSCHLSAEIDLPAFCYSAFTHPEFFYLLTTQLKHFSVWIRAVVTSKSLWHQCGIMRSALLLDVAEEDQWPSRGREQPPCSGEPAGQQAGEPSSICQSPA